MGVGKLALKALEWIGRIIGLVQTPIGKEFTRTILGKVLGDRAPHYMAKLAQLESTIGAHTACWAKVSAGAATGDVVTLDPDEVKYLNRFKELWDKHVKKPMDKAAIKLQATPPSEDEQVVIAIANALIADEPDDDDGTAETP